MSSDSEIVSARTHNSLHLAADGASYGTVNVSGHGSRHQVVEGTSEKLGA